MQTIPEAEEEGDAPKNFGMRDEQASEISKLWSPSDLLTRRRPPVLALEDDGGPSSAIQAPLGCSSWLARTGSPGRCSTLQERLKAAEEALHLMGVRSPCPSLKFPNISPISVLDGGFASPMSPDEAREGDSCVFDLRGGLRACSKLSEPGGLEGTAVRWFTGEGSKAADSIEGAESIVAGPSGQGLDSPMEDEASSPDRPQDVPADGINEQASIGEASVEGEEFKLRSSLRRTECADGDFKLRSTLRPTDWGISKMAREWGVQEAQPLERVLFSNWPPRAKKLKGGESLELAIPKGRRPPRAPLSQSSRSSLLSVEAESAVSEGVLSRGVRPTTSEGSAYASVSANMEEPGTPTTPQTPQTGLLQPTVLRCPDAPQPRRELSRASSLNETKVLMTTSLKRSHSIFLFDKHFEYIREIGRGSFSTVFEARDRRSKQQYAIKRSRRQFRGIEDRARYVREVQSVAELSEHPHVVKYFRGWQQDSHFYIQMELCEGGNLRGYLDSLGGLPDESTIWNWIAQVASGLEHLHARGVLHLDIKPENIFLEGAGTLKIGDFGTAVLKREWEWEEGDGAYVAPELLREEEPGPEADMYSFGAMLHEWVTGVALPRSGPKREGKGLEVPSHRSPALGRLVTALLNGQPDKRPSATEVLAWRETIME